MRQTYRAFQKDPRRNYRAPGLEEWGWAEHGFGTRQSVEWPGERLVASLQQIHSDVVVAVDEQTGCLGQGDALITNRPGVWVTVRTADCVPVLLLDRRRKVVAAIHAGWRGTAASITPKTVGHMGEKYGTEPEDVIAAIGPSIGGCCYEVSRDVAERFREWTAVTGKIHLPAVNREQLLRAGVRENHIYLAEMCTRCVEQEFHSYRRDGDRSGRMVSGIAVVE